MGDLWGQPEGRGWHCRAQSSPRDGQGHAVGLDTCRLVPPRPGQWRRSEAELGLGWWRKESPDRIFSTYSVPWKILEGIQLRCNK